MKRTISVLAAFLLLLGLTACNNNAAQTSNVEQQSSQKAEASNDLSDETKTDSSDTVAEGTENVQGRGDTLVVYFSQTGNTKEVAQKIADITGADIYEIKAAEEYTSDDLNYNDSDSRATREQGDASVRPGIGSAALTLDGYTTIYIGYPIWWGEEPRIMDTFVESYDFVGITMIPFCTSGSSGIGRSGQNLADNAGSGTWLEGKRFGAGASEEDIKAWIEEIQ